MADDWYVVPKGKEKIGPLSESEVRDMIRQGWLWPISLAWRPGLPGWRRAGELDEFADDFLASRHKGAQDDTDADEINKTLRAGWKSLKSFLNRGKDEITRTAHAADLHLKMRSLQTERRREVVSVGEGALRDGAAFLQSEDYRNLCAKIRELDDRIASCRRQLESMRTAPDGEEEDPGEQATDADGPASARDDTSPPHCGA